MHKETQCPGSVFKSDSDSDRLKIGTYFNDLYNKRKEQQNQLGNLLSLYLCVCMQRFHITLNYKLQHILVLSLHISAYRGNNYWVRQP